MVERLTLDLPIEWEFTWTETEVSTTHNCLAATSGILLLEIQGDALWGSDDSDWTWIDLLDWLTRSWVWLRGEDGLPPAMQSYLGSFPMDSLKALKSRLTQETYSEPSRYRARIEMLLWDFLETHDLSRALSGASSPPVVLWREGLIGHVLTDGSHYVTGWQQILDMLNGMGDAIAARLDILQDDHRARFASAAWRSRNEVPASRWLEIARAQDDLDVTQPLPTHWEDLAADDVERSPILAAARMTSKLPAQLAEVILAQISAIPFQPTIIDEISVAVSDIAQIGADAPPWEEAHKYAQALRAYLGINEDSVFKPEPWLATLGVSVNDVELGVKDIEAIAVWGPRNGPAIIINRDGRYSSRPSGRNASLAHEIGHLLMDRARALPAAEVLGGRVHAIVEQRARAFAAEVLLPQATAGRRMSNATSGAATRAIVASLARRYGVSYEVVAWQARNSDATLSVSALEYLRTLVSYPERF